MTSGRSGAEELSDTDRRHLDAARALARRGRGRVEPNPMVGCRIVADDGESGDGGKGDGVVGEGWHREFGGPHAEIEALKASGDAAHGSTAYVSLEPCNHQGKTPPCTEALIEAGIARVVFGAADPGEASGGGAARLRQAGLEVVGPVWSPDEARAENPRFFHDDPHRPWVALKLAVSLDGAVSRDRSGPTALSGPEAWARVHRLRAGVDAVLVGAGTVRADVPRLTARGDRIPPTSVTRVVLDPGAGWFRQARARGLEGVAGSLLDPDAPPVRVVVREDLARERRNELEGLAPTVLAVPACTGENGIDPRALMGRLRADGVRALLCEGGARWARALIAASLVDRLILVIAPVTLGPDAVAAWPLAEGRWRPVDEPERLGDDIWCEWDCDRMNREA